MAIFIAGSSHTGKTALAQRPLETYHYPYLSIDHPEMGLIRSGHTGLTPEDDDILTAYLWPIVREMVKTAIEDQQNLVIESCYIPFDWEQNFDKSYLERIRYYCLIMTERYTNRHFTDIQKHANTVEKRLGDTWLTRENLILDNTKSLAMCRQYGYEYLLIDEGYRIDIESR